MDVPLFLGFGRAYRSSGAKSDLDAAIAEHESLRRGVELEVWTTYSRMIEAGEAIDAAEKFVASAEESARVAEGRYQTGVGSIIELVDSQTVRTRALTRRIQARLDWYTAMSRFQRAVGRTLAGVDGGAAE